LAVHQLLVNSVNIDVWLPVAQFLANALDPDSWPCINFW
jgi:hypothetical protein